MQHDQQTQTVEKTVISRCGG